MKAAASSPPKNPLFGKQPPAPTRRTTDDPIPAQTRVPKVGPGMLGGFKKEDIVYSLQDLSYSHPDPSYCKNTPRGTRGIVQGPAPDKLCRIQVKFDVGGQWDMNALHLTTRMPDEGASALGPTLS